MKDMFSIGELARYQNISKQTLIFYDKIGLFRPAYVDPDNKYRYYKAKSDRLSGYNFNYERNGIFTWRDPGTYENVYDQYVIDRIEKTIDRT